MADRFIGHRAYGAYRAAGLSAYEAGVGERFDRASHAETGAVNYGIGLQPAREAKFCAAVVIEGTELLARHDAYAKTADLSAKAVARTLSNTEVADAVVTRVEEIGTGYRHVAASDIALIIEATRRLRAR